MALTSPGSSLLMASAKMARQPRELAPTHGAALHGVGRIGKRGGDLAEIGAALDLRRAPSRRARGGRCICSGLACSGTRTRMCDRSNSSLLPSCDLRASEQVVDLAFGDHDLVVDLALAQARHHDLVADVFAELGEAARRPSRASRATSPASSCCCSAMRAIALSSSPSSTRKPVSLANCSCTLVVDHALEHLLFEHVARRRRRALLAQLDRTRPACGRPDRARVITSSFTTATMRSSSTIALAPALARPPGTHRRTRARPAAWICAVSCEKRINDLPRIC